MTNDFSSNRLVAGFFIEYTYKHKIPCAAAKFGHACSHGLLRGRNVKKLEQGGMEEKMTGEITKYFDHSFIILLTLILMAIGILYQVAIGVIYQRMIQATDTLSGTENKLLVQCKERFVNSYKLNGGVANISVFVDKFINRIRVCGMSMNFMKHLSGQLMLAGVFVAGFGVCKGIIEGRGFIEVLPFYIISLLGIYLYLSIMSIVDMPNRRKMLKTNITDYLENTVAQRLEHGIMEKEKLLWELAQEKEADMLKKDEDVWEGEELERTKTPVFTPDETRELEELLRGIIANKV